jgi:histidyl-tRNA synthetase
LGLDRIILALDSVRRRHLDAFLVSETGAQDGLRVASRLRAEGVRIDLDLDGRSVKAQFRAARRLDVPVIVVWKGDGHLVDVQTDTERAELPLQEVSNWLKG